MTVTYGFYNSIAGDRVYDALDISSIFDGVIADGVFQSVGGAFAISANGGMDIRVEDGRAWFNHTWTRNDAPLILTLDAAEIVLDRIDRIIIEVNADPSVRANTIKILKGTPASTPSAPALINTATVNQYPLVNIYVAAGITEILAEDLDNKIGTSLCPFVTGVLETIDIGWLFAQWDAQFNTWFDNLVDQLTGVQVTNLQAQIDAFGSQPFMYRNLIINGAMNVSQRGTSESGVTTGGYKKSPDRWQHDLTTLGSWTVSKSPATDLVELAGFGSTYKMLCNTADASPGVADIFTLKTILEGQTLQRIRKGFAEAENLALSFWVRSKKTGTYIAELVDLDNNRSISRAYTVDVVDTWEKKTLLFPGDVLSGSDLENDNNGSMALVLWFGAGANYTSGTLQTSWGTLVNANRAVGQFNLAGSVNNYAEVTGIQLEVGLVATLFEHLPYDIELARCLRYYYVHAETTPNPIGIGFYSGSTIVRMVVSFMERMRATPTLVCPSGTNYYLFTAAGSNDYLDTITLDSASNNAAVLISSNGSGTSGNSGSVRVADAAGKVEFNAEL